MLQGVLWAIVAALATVVGPSSPASTSEEAAATVELPPANVDWDYQIGGSSPPAAGVGVVSRDRSVAPSADAYNICYVNAFQTQRHERAFWEHTWEHWALVLKDRSGRAVVDQSWGEWLLDTRTARKRRSLMAVVGPWIDGCAAAGFQGVEFDNLDSWDRAAGLITRRDNKAFARLLTARAHAAGLAAGQKNWAELSPRGPALGFDFAVAEECGRYRECGSYAAAYADRVYVVEYRDPDFDRACRRWGSRLSIVRRDVDVTPGGINRRC
ncbi:endo alpha-1,4 polygalactosaminidase [Nocardioides sp.]|uniref:endo alpha-1,4 polygalactosaminidase n=1 Tax=Nocardioides sp. TaxID=35761 RepID=UPI002BA4B9C6|nr:endo alpha-1,4 polygalactosaminidase [Nocardioides sp.]HXH80833.1 endo alpha-1,4 polygalactosaminidase [Nocardioides sp.]